LIFSEGFKKSRLQNIVKRVLDVVLAVVGLIVLLPVLALVALAVKCSSRGPVLYRQERVGQNGRVFLVQKFRSMQEDAERNTGAVWAQPHDSRVTTVGRILRRTRLDELPQLWNVLCGHMSFVGPRPERPEFVSALTRDIAYYGQRHTIKPGLTGWAQVRYTYGASVEDAMEKLQYDLFYIKNRNIALDLFIIAKTIKTVLMGKGAQ
jgi:exopolysaccharide biosynthesis polyprenyl glycosylphosphotransferase